MIGHPDFNNPDSEQVVAIEDNPYIMVQKKRARGEHRRSKDWRSLSFEPLPSTKEEINQIASIYEENRPDVYVQQRAT